MKKRINLVLIGVLTVTSLLLAIVFTPMRSSFTKISRNYVDKTATSFGVDLNSKLKNARIVANLKQYDVSGLEVMGFINAKGNLIPLGSDVASTINYTNALYSSSNEIQTGNNNGVGVAESSFSSTSKRGDNNSGMNNINSGDFNGANSGTTSIAMLTKNSTTENAISSAKQSGRMNAGGTNPGIDPIGSLPVGDGLNIMLGLVALFGLFKFWKH